jgi:hypothetical protein
MRQLLFFDEADIYLPVGHLKASALISVDDVGA